MLEIFYASIIFHIISVGILIFKGTADSRISIPLLTLGIASLLADGISAAFYGTEINTLSIVNIYSFAEVLIVTWIVLRSYMFNRILKLAITFTSSIIALLILIFSILHGLNTQLDFLWTTALVFEAVLTIMTCVLIVTNLNRNEARLPKEILILIGIFIYTTCSIIPIASFNFRIEHLDPILASTVYSIFVCSGNMIRDIAISIFALRLERSKLQY